MKNANELHAALSEFGGSEICYHHTLNKSFNYTEGVRAFFQHAGGGGAYWLGDILASEPAIQKAVVAEGFCVMVLTVIGSSAQLVIARDVASGDTVFDEPVDVVFTRAISFTDCPEGVWKLFLTWTETEGGEVMMAMLPGEY
jgi:hypothetical protein